jgi:hypothetical protein
MADKIETKDTIYVIKRVNYGEDQSITKTTQIIQEVDPSTLELKSSQIVHDGIYSNGALVRDILDDLQYLPLAISSFTLNGYTTQVREKGNTLTDLSFVWAYNKEVQSQSITDISLEASDRAVTVVGQSITDDSTWVLTGNDGARTVDEHVHAVFYHSIRWLAMEEQTITSAILDTWNYKLNPNLNHAFTVEPGANEYIYFASPKAYGIPSFWIGGFEESFDVTEFSYENQYGVTEDYYICKSEVKGLGLTTINITPEGT